MATKILESFADDVVSRGKQKDGWIETLIPVVMPILMEMLTKCFDKAAALQSFAEGKRSRLQLSGLRLRCNQSARGAGVQGYRRIQKAGDALADAILEELDNRAGNAAGSIYQDAIDEAMSV
jgi:hypothetical protein